MFWQGRAAFQQGARLPWSYIQQARGNKNVSDLGPPCAAAPVTFPFFSSCPRLLTLAELCQGLGVAGTPWSVSREPAGAGGTPTAGKQPTSHWKKNTCEKWKRQSGGNIVFCGVKVVVTYQQRKSSNSWVSFHLDRKENKLVKSFGLPSQRPYVWAASATPLAFSSYPPPPAPHQSFSPKKACVCVRRSKSLGNEQVLWQEALYPNYLRCGFTSRP